MTPVELIQDHESRRTVPYLDSEGILSWGIGRNLRDVPFSADELALVNQIIELMFANDMRRVLADLATFPWFTGLDDARRAAVIDLRFNLGPTRFRGFRKFLAAMAARDYGRAGAELIDSKWYTQVARRGPRIVKLIQLGEWP